MLIQITGKTPAITNQMIGRIIYKYNHTNINRIREHTLLKLMDKSLQTHKSLQEELQRYTLLAEEEKVEEEEVVEEEKEEEEEFLKNMDQPKNLQVVKVKVQKKKKKKRFMKKKKKKKKRFMKKFICCVLMLKLLLMN